MTKLCRIFKPKLKICLTNYTKMKKQLEVTNLKSTITKEEFRNLKIPSTKRKANVQIFSKNSPRYKEKKKDGKRDFRPWKDKRMKEFICLKNKRKFWKKYKVTQVCPDKNKFSGAIKIQEMEF